MPRLLIVVRTISNLLQAGVLKPSEVVDYAKKLDTMNDWGLLAQMVASHELVNP